MGVAAQDSSDDLIEAADRAAPQDVDSGPGARDEDAREEAPSRRPLIAGALGATWALVVGVGLVACLVMLAWALSPNSGGESGAAWRAVGLVWLGAHQVPLQVSGLPLTLYPLGALLPGLLLTRRGGAWSARLVVAPSPAEMLGLVAGAALAYGCGGAVLAWLSATQTTGASPLRALLVAGTVGAIGASWGIGRETGLLWLVRARVSHATWRTLAAGVTGALGLFVTGAALLAASLIAHVGDAVASLAAVSTGAAATVGLTLVDILSLPTLAVWAASLAVGPGFAIGDLGHLSVLGGEIATLPALPVLAAIPATAPGWAPILLVAPVLCGALAGRVRWREDLPTWPGALIAAAAVGGVLAPIVALAVALTSGSLGGGRLDQVGPDLATVTLAAVALVVLGFLGEAGLQTLRLSWDLHQASLRGLPQPAPGPRSSDAGPDPADELDGLIGVGDPIGAVAADAPAPGDGADSAPRSLTSVVTSAGSAARSRMVWVAGAASSRVQVVAGATAGRLRPSTAAEEGVDHTNGGDPAPDGSAAPGPRPGDPEAATAEASATESPKTSEATAEVSSPESPDTSEATAEVSSPERPDTSEAPAAVRPADSIDPTETAELPVVGSAQRSSDDPAADDPAADGRADPGPAAAEEPDPSHAGCSDAAGAGPPAPGSAAGDPPWAGL